VSLTLTWPSIDLSIVIAHCPEMESESHLPYPINWYSIVNVSYRNIVILRERSIFVIFVVVEINCHIMPFFAAKMTQTDALVGESDIRIEWNQLVLT
jgi:hypothetical protein